MQHRPGRRDLRQTPLDRRVDVLVRFAELEVAAVQLSLDAAETSLDRRELRLRDDAGCGEPASVRDAAGDVEGVKLEIRLERRSEPLELRVEGLAKTSAPQLSYGVSLLTSPSRLPSSRAWSWPWTCADVRTPMPHSLMKPAAADWSNTSPFPYVARES